MAEPTAFDEGFQGDAFQGGGEPGTPVSPIVGIWKDTYLHDPSGYGLGEPMGEFPFGGTVWEIVI